MMMKNNSYLKLTIHILFWLFYVVVAFFLMPNFSGHEMTLLERIDFKLLPLVLTLTYFNDLYLLPTLFQKKQYALYGFLIVAIVLLATALYCNHIIDCSCSFGMCLSQQLWKFLLPVIFLSLIHILSSFFEKQKELENTQKERVEMELKFLKSQINPHVLFNNLNTVYAQAVKGSDNVADMILMLSENLKYILYQSEEKLVSLQMDVDFIDNYLEFQTLRTQGINRIVFNKTIDSYNHKIAPLLLIGLIENAFKHSSFKEDALSDILIDLSVKNGILKFKCMNEVDAESGKRETEGFQIGLKNLEKRLNLIYPKKHRFFVENNEKTFTAHLEIDLK
ncbi:histidine kinase [Polaribacter batillariae]|uniref:Histidine kinase n=1 Tax=Polaribacter batillariae TaxID=2808900 RepID=A0ABX7SUE3_9FLAO|nr:sensor histidine kinase [Polaribacter batillariae]QTD36586.1 histidine kinase [Polaribacter batillariae]